MARLSCTSHRDDEGVPRKPPPALRTSLYRLVEVPKLLSAIQPKYLERQTFSAEENTVGGRDAVLVLGTIATPTVSWAPALHALTGTPITLGNDTAVGVLLVRGANDSAWALSYGMGFQALEPSHIDPGFGQRIALRTADPRELNSVTRTTLDQRSKTDRFNIPSGDDLRGFGVGDFGEIVTRLVAKASLPELTGGTKPLRIRGADALSVPLGRTPDSLIADLDILDAILTKPAAPGLAVLEQLVPVKRPEVISSLEDALEDELDADDPKLGLSWPHERIDDNSTPSSFKFIGAGRSKPQDDVPELDHVLEALKKATTGERVERLSTLKVQLYREVDEPMSKAIPVRQWLAFETEDHGQRYCLHDGKWYAMNQGYAEKLKARTREIFERDPGVVLPSWPTGMAEKDYNDLVAADMGGVSLDRDLIRTELHHRGIEACDVLAKDGTLIHIKKIDSSEPASHHIAQALVSADALLYDAEAKKKMREKVVAEGRDPDLVPDKIARVVLGMARTKAPPTADTLFTFTQVTLVRAVQALGARGVGVFIAPITRS